MLPQCTWCASAARSGRYPPTHAGRKRDVRRREPRGSEFAGREQRQRRVPVVRECSGHAGLIERL